jgi:FAD-linked sulfhydryl oxidase
MAKLIYGFSHIYACKDCAKDFRGTIDQKPPMLDSRKDFALWLCDQHNIVNAKLGKPVFNCTIRRLELIYGRKSLRNIPTLL